MTLKETPVRRRPRNRRQMVVDAAGPVFSERGYHGASMEEVAAKVGITAAALYRHFPNKYALFAQCANRMVDDLLEVLELDPRPEGLGELLPALAEVTLGNRASGGLYRWESRYLEAEDRAGLRTKFGVLVDATAHAVAREHPGPEILLRANAALGAIGSITQHRTPFARGKAVELLCGAADRVASADLSTVPASASVVVLPQRQDPRGRRGEILGVAIPLFAEHGYHNVSMGQIAGELGMGSSAIYRHYPVKADILAAACLQAAAFLEHAVAQSLHAVRSEGLTGAHASLVALVSTYVAYSFEDSALRSVAEAEIIGLPADLQRPVRLAQREHVSLWEQLLAQARPELEPRQARTLAHAGFGVVVESGRHLRWEDTPAHRDAVTALVLAALGIAA
ncbi:TetR/AcrR family transcriptional regulator [Nocardioides yefusunii]|uniref:TetR/AcrR family transcriptional regulator n=1 Tax=Nocardioides yefusunii TaxID=2500546 RepID=A0ABW1R0A4_9ACTN|nr:TetR/AcrR family transcriptional regulator [Nocardioides yefusunii]